MKKYYLDFREWVLRQLKRLDSQTVRFLNYIESLITKVLKSNRIEILIVFLVYIYLGWLAFVLLLPVVYQKYGIGTSQIKAYGSIITAIVDILKGGGSKAD